MWNNDKEKGEKNKKNGISKTQEKKSRARSM
jgi:hypothetical protein